MDKFIKIQSNQSEFSNTANLVDFIIPQGDTYDLSDSWVNLQYQLNVVETETASGIGIYNVDLGWATADAEDPKFFNSAIVRDCNMECSRKGLIESLRRCDIISQVRQTYEKSWGEARADSYLSADQLIDPINVQSYGITRQFNKEGVNKSIVNPNVNIMIKLGDLMDFCNTPEYDTNRAGQTRIHLRLNMDKLVIKQKMVDAHIQPVEVKTFKEISTVAVPVNNITLGNNAGTTTLRITNLDQVPYYVGMKVLITATHTDGGANDRADAPAVIAAIDWDKDTDGSYTLIFEQPWGVTLAAAKVYNAITVKPQAPIDGASNVTLAQAQLCLKRVKNPVGGDEIDYTTFSTEQGFGSNQTAFSDLFVIEPESTNLLMTFQDSADDLISRNDGLATYQIAVDNIPQTDRLVAKNSPLDYDRKSATFRRLGNGLRNLTGNAGDAGLTAPWSGVYTQSKFNSTIIACPLPVSPIQKQLQVQINGGGGGVGKYALFKSLPRRLVY